MDNQQFQEFIWQKGRELYREMPWREDTRPYYILVSELMLQQTQVDRVIPKFNAFIEQFPDVVTLAKAPLADVLKLWSGLGYNRRAKYLHDSARMILTDFNGTFPSTVADILRLSGVGPGTSGAILTYAFNQPVPFIETNVRTVYFYHFFPDFDKVSDAELLPLINQTLDREHPRQFYWALMDYGTWLKKNGAKNTAQSQHYQKQTALKGSLREMRGMIIKQLTIADMSAGSLQLTYGNDPRLQPALEGLIRDGLLNKTNGILHLTK